MKVLIALGIAAVVMLAMVFLAVILFVATVAVDIASEFMDYQRLCIYHHNETRPDTCTGHRPRRWTLSLFDRA